MTGNGAYEGEMSEVDLFQSVLRAAVPTQPDPGIEVDLVPRLAQIARAASIEAGQRESTVPARRVGRRRPRRLLVARVGIAVASLPLLFAGLAFAGVTVPDAARSAFESVGVELPNQPADDEADTGAGSGDGAADDQEPARSAGSAGQSSKEEQNGRAKARGKSKGDDGSKPGRRVRRHGQGPIPGPASPPEGKALGQAKQDSTGSGSQGNAGGGSGEGGGSANPGGSGGNSGGSSGARGKPD